MSRRKYGRRSRTALRVFKVLCVLGLVAGSIDLLSLPAGDEYLTKNPRHWALLEAREYEAEARGASVRFSHQWVPLAQVSPVFIRALLIAEDFNFHSHHGFDFGEMWHAFKNALLKFEFPRGASTITQQLAKNLYLSESKNPWRKVREALLTMKLEYALSKQRILELYINIIELGQGIYGVEAAAQHYFGTSARALTLEQAATLAAIIPNPRSVYNLERHPERVEQRKRMILRRLRKTNNF